MRRFGIIAVIASCLVLAVTADAGGSPHADALTAYQSADYERAMKLFRPLAEQGDPQAEYYVGRMYEKGQGVEKDNEQMALWYRRSAEKGYARAQYKLAVGYAFGLGGAEQDDAEAVKWLKRSAEGGYRRAQKTLARGYSEGRFGLPRDPRQAEYWNRKAARR
ncbi:Sel1 repeat-containing protein [Sulfurifustis variabilis]|uniref:Sel1 repeat-containing protein n=1 Tax=Sulfurifustis variabilis TaxID=1675686 RepID=A0A1B4V4U4_9GAMM|nr:tetratricopeptide repeat protein [Sulfurifustis variabilis]BAU48549.1 Sel1 repeat-containing protein [Sulfurifustis variabilis]